MEYSLTRLSLFWDSAWHPLYQKKSRWQFIFRLNASMPCFKYEARIGPTPAAKFAKEAIKGC
jgi:hypothetical protein